MMKEKPQSALTPRASKSTPRKPSASHKVQSPPGAGPSRNQHDLERLSRTATEPQLESGDEGDLMARFRSTAVQVQAESGQPSHNSNTQPARPKKDIIRTPKNSYDILGRIRKGGFSNVFEVQKSGLDPLNSGKFACKVVDYSRHNGLSIVDPDSKNPVDSNVFRAVQHGAKMVTNELTTWKDINNHPNVIQLLDWVREGECKIIFVMPRATADTLADYHVPVAFDKALVLIAQVMDGVIWMHDKNYTHRDLKPSNILLTTEGNRLKAMVADFGISMRGATHTYKSGTPGFRAPEVLSELTHDNKAGHTAGTFISGAIARPSERWTVKAARRHPLVRDIVSSTATDAVVSEQPVAESAVLSPYSDAISPFVPTEIEIVSLASTGILLIEPMEHVPVTASLSTLIVEGMLLNPSALDNLSTTSVPPPTGPTSTKRKREVLDSPPEVAMAEDVSNPKRRKGDLPADDGKQVKGKLVWSLDRVKETASYFKSVWSVRNWWRRG
ncbi:Serine/threonine-protein kinase H1 [Tulasnella sp. JGI-2019a]|nr:Serine/threonine-protein kinase H1 [Tulasnella sp. JGI-2019a]